MKNLLVLLFFVCMINLVSAPCASASANDFTLNYPAYTLKVPTSFMTVDSMVMIYGPEPMTTFNLITNPETEKNLEQYTAFSKEQIKGIPDFKVEKEGFETYNGVKFASAVNKFKSEDMTLRSKGVWTIQNKKAHVMTYTAGDASFDKYLKDAEGMFAGFDIANSALKVPAGFAGENSIVMVFGETINEFRINFNVIVKAEKEKTLEQYTAYSKEEVKKVPDFKIEKEGYETYNGVKFYSMTSKMVNNDVKLKAKSAWTIIDGKAYILTYTSTEGAFDKYLRDAESMMNNFSIVKK